MSIVRLIEELDLPPILYKYRNYQDVNYCNKVEKISLSYATQSLLKKELFIPSANTFNDPYDSAVPFRYDPKDLIEDNIFIKCLELAKRQYPKADDTFLHHYAFENQKKGLINNPDHIEEHDRDTYNKTCRDFGIFCLTTDEKNLLMWSYYADSHRGFCVGYDTKYLIESKVFGMGGKVIYRDDFPTVPLFPDERSHHFLDLFYTKWAVWEHENEYRLLHIYRTGKIHPYAPENIQEIILGCKFPEKDKLEFATKLLQVYPHVRIYEIKLDKSIFRLEKQLFIDGTL